MSWETIKKGKRVGTRVSNHNTSPCLEASKVCAGKTRKKVKRILRMIKGKSFFNVIPTKRFLYFMLDLKEIYRFF